MKTSSHLPNLCFALFIRRKSNYMKPFRPLFIYMDGVLNFQMYSIGQEKVAYQAQQGQAMGFIEMNNRSGIAYDDSHLGPNASSFAHSISSRAKRSIISTRFRRRNSDMAARITSGSEEKTPALT